MEDNPSNVSEPCVNCCNFYGHPNYNHMCSQCYKEAKTGQSAEKTIEPPIRGTASSLTPQVTVKTLTSELPPPASPLPSIEPEQTLKQPTSNTTSSVVVAQDAPVLLATDVIQPRPVQKNKARCFLCRAKIPLAKQTINKCRCEYVYCDLHKVPDKHDCDFDFAKMGKDILTKNNPKLNDVHKGGRSFNRID